MPRNLYCNVLETSPNVQNLVSKIFAKYCKRFVSKVSCLVSFKSRSRPKFLLKISVSQRQCLDSVSKILAETPALVLIVIKVTLLLKMTVPSCFYSDSDILNLFKAKSELISLRFFIAAPILF